MSEPSEAIIDLLQDVQRRLFEHVRSTFRELEVPRAEMMVMLQVDEQPGVALSELARRCGIVKSHVSNTVEELHRRGLVDRRPDPADQRLMRLYLTAAAGERLSRLRERMRGRLAEVAAAVPEAQQPALAETLGILRDALERARERRPGG
jgi:DNA-binding MarR family transcriptional regulator